MTENLKEQLSRTELLLGASAMEKLCHARVAVFGVGGVGGFVVEALVRSGVGAFEPPDYCLAQHGRKAENRSDGRENTRYQSGSQSGAA